jgi:CheY-like chemotaxis protein
MSPRILVVEDELLIQKTIKRLLERSGCTVDVEASGKRAIEEILANDYDRVVCDLMLQDISGFNVIEEAKKRYSPDQISKLFIIITAYSSLQVLEQANKYGCMVLSKPFDDITKAINLFIKGKNDDDTD